MSDRLLADQAQRDRICTDLATNLLVEAGAGSGKTRQLLRRMVALIVTGEADVGEIAAVTFTRKAAAELRERFQTRLEREVSTARKDRNNEAARLLDAAVHDIDRGFIGTIHAFCARLLRERPIDAGLDPSFREIFGPEEERLRRDSWLRHLERLTHDGDPSLAELAALNLQYFRLEFTYRILLEHPDVVFEADEVPAPEIGNLRDELNEILDDGLKILPDREPSGKWDNLGKRLLALRNSRIGGRWDDDAVFFDAIEIVVDHDSKPTFVRWGADEAEATDLWQRIVRFVGEGGAAETLKQWWAHRYGVALRFAHRAAGEFEKERRRAGLLTFNDLLMKAAELLRDNPSARRDLGHRYRYLLVDEFQDTDPIQAEIVFLLTAKNPEEKAWHEAEPRPGSLFVVGDPKQSIYRFRRADIAIYNQVKERFRAFGDVVELTTNFRSFPPIETFVNGVFERLLPAQADEHQAAYAPLNVAEAGTDPQGVFWYEIESSSWGHEAVARAEAPRLASWIALRIEEGERQASDFMILAYRKQDLKIYATELEKRNVPVEVTGAGVEIARELDELIVVLKALADPDNSVLTVAALVGLFFGIDHEQLTAHVESRMAQRAEEVAGWRSPPGAFDFRLFGKVGDEASPVELALARLHDWWKETRNLPADIVVDTIINHLGLLPYLAAGDSGESNAGALTYVVNAVRQAGLQGDTSLDAALAALEEALRAEDVEAPLQPGRTNAVRVMNLHKAKGLEAKVVVLAHPVNYPKKKPRLAIERRETGRPRGVVLIDCKVGWSNVKLAAPADWDEHAKAEKPFLDAEYHRLLYVAATRAEEELVIGYCKASKRSSAWLPFYDFLEPLCTRIELPDDTAPERRPLEITGDEISGEIDALREDRASRALPSYEIAAVTRLVKHDASIFAVDQGGLGRSWGNAVHQAMEAVGRGTSDEQLRTVCRTALLENDLPIGTDGEPDDLEDLVHLVEKVLQSETWQRAVAADKLLSEVPFAAAELAADGTPRVVEGVVDLAFREPDGWVIVDYKTDVVEDPENLEARRSQYRSQVDEYARLWNELTGETVKERQILWVGMDLSAETW